MRMTTNTSLSALAVAIALPSAAWAAGFQINEHNAKATSRAGAVAATVDDPSAIFYNPAGLASIKGTEVTLGVALIAPANDYTGIGYNNPTGAPVTQATETGMVPVPNIYIAREISPKAFFGVGFYAPYGLGIKWADDWVGRTVVQELSLRTFFFTPSIGLKLTDEVQVGVSVSLVPSTLYLRRALGDASGEALFPNGGAGDGSVEMSASAFGVGANAGVQVKLIDNLRIGFSYRSAVGLDFAGNADFTLPEGFTSSIQSRFPDGGVTGQLTLPHSFALGIGWVDGPLTVEVTGNLTLWQSYDELRIGFDEGRPQPESVAPRDWKAAPTFRLGGEYEIEKNYFARLGFAYDITPVPDSTIDPTLPDNDRVIFSLGVGANFEPISVDVGYMGVIVLSRDANDSVNFAQGSYGGGLVSVIAASVGVSI